MDATQAIVTLEDLRQAAEAGDPQAQSDLGWRFHCGDGVPENSAEALKWFHKAAAQENASARNRLGLCYEFGEGVQQDLAEAVRWYRLAAEQGYDDAQYNLAICFKDGVGLPANQPEAVRWLKQAAGQGHAMAQLLLSNAYEKGEGVAPDRSEALRLLRLSAENGEEQAQVCLGLKYLHGEDVSRDPATAIEWIRRAAEAGNPFGQSVYGDCLVHGLGIPKDPAAGVQWLLKGAGQGDSSGQCLLGFCFASGLGVERDFAEARKWFSLAAAQGEVEALYPLRALWFQQRPAFKWLRRSMLATGTILLLLHAWSAPIEVHWFPVAAFFTIVVSIGVLFSLLAGLLLERFASMPPDSKANRTKEEHHMSDALGSIITKRPWKLLLVPAEDGFFLLPLLYLGINPLSAAVAATLFAAFHYPAFPWRFCIPKGIAYFFVALYVLPSGIWSVVIAHLLLDITVSTFASFSSSDPSPQPS